MLIIIKDQAKLHTVCNAQLGNLCIKIVKDVVRKRLQELPLLSKNTHGLCFLLKIFLYFPNYMWWIVTLMVKNLPAEWETQVWSLGREDPLEKGVPTHSSVLAWRIPWTRSPVGHSPWRHTESDPNGWLTQLTVYYYYYFSNKQRCSAKKSTNLVSLQNFRMRELELMVGHPPAWQGGSVWPLLLLRRIPAGAGDPSSKGLLVLSVTKILSSTYDKN